MNCGAKMLEGPKIESYEPYHIGIRMRQGLDKNFMKKFRDLLKITNFEMLDPVEYNVPPVLDIASDKNVMIQMNFPANSINVFGDTPADVNESLDKILELINKMGIDIKFGISFFELIAELSIITKEVPSDIFRNFIDWDLDFFEKLNVSTTGIKLSTEMVDETEIFEFTIEPKLLSPKTRYHSRILLDLKIFKKSMIYKIILNQLLLVLSIRLRRGYNDNFDNAKKRQI